MLKHRFRRYSVALLFVMMLQVIAPVINQVSAAEQPALGLNVKSAILMDAETGQILYKENHDVGRPPASMAKMMTEYLVMEEIASGRLSWDDMIYTPKAARDAGGSGQLMAEGKSYNAKQVFELLSIYSGNDAAVAFAYHIAGSEEEFAKLMNETAKKIGLSDKAYFINATGLPRADMKDYAPASLPGETQMTAEDAAKLARAIIHEHPEVLEFTKIPSKKFQETDKEPMINWNWMVEGNKDSTNLKQYAYEGLDGLKTGHTSAAGYNFTGTAERNGMRLISVVMGAENNAARFAETRKLLDYGFNTFEKRTILAAKTEIPEVPTVRIRNAVKLDVPVVLGEGVQLIVKKSEEAVPEITEVTFIPEDQLQAPMDAQTQVGTAKVTYGEHQIEVPVIVAENVEKASWFKMLMRSIGGFFSGLFNGIVNLF